MFDIKSHKLIFEGIDKNGEHETNTFHLRPDNHKCIYEWFKENYACYRKSENEKVYSISKSVVDLLKMIKDYEVTDGVSITFTWLQDMCLRFGYENSTVQYHVILKDNPCGTAKGEEVNMGFGEALEQLNYYERVYRGGWDKFYKYIRLQVPPDIVNYKMTEPYIYICMDDDKYVPWTPTYHDLLATDWKVYHD